MKALVPANFLPLVQEAASQLGVDLVSYTPSGEPQGDSEGAELMLRWWLSSDQGDRLIDLHPSIRWIHTGSAGVDHILTPLFRGSGIVLTNSSGVHAVSIAEWIVASILATEKNFKRLLEQQRDHQWESFETDELEGKQIVFLGAGHIATEAARRLRPFGVTLSAVRRVPASGSDFHHEYAVEELRTVVRNADWLIVTVPLTPDTERIVDRSVLDALPPRARILNVARGEVIDEQALSESLERGSIAGAVLDVFQTEPLPQGHRFWSAGNVVVLPHTTWKSSAIRRKQAELFIENLRRFVRSEPLLNVVDPDRGY